MSSDNGGSATPELINEPDILVEGFERLEPTLLESRAPKLRPLPKFFDREPARQIEYLMKLAATMNHAAKLIQDERDKLVKMMEKKEQQLEKMETAVRQNLEMLQGEVTRMNEERQGWNAESAQLRARIRELEEHGSVD